MTFKIIIRKKILKNIDKIYPYKHKIIKTLSFLQHNPFPEQHDIKKLKGKKDTFRIRIGNIRIIYKIIWDEEIIYIEDIDFRENIY